MTNPYGQQPYGQPVYGQPVYYQAYGYPQGYGMPVGPPPGPKPPSYLGWAIGCIFLFWPVAIVAIIKATSVDSAWQMGRYVEAQESSRSAKTLCLVSTIIGAVVFVFSIIMVIVALNTIDDYVPRYDY